MEWITDMSQSGRIVLNQPVPGAGIEKITGNAGGAVSGDGAANVNLVGAGTITVTGTPGTNTLTITSTGVPASYQTDGGVATPDGGGVLGVHGGANIETSASLDGHSVDIDLTDDVDIPGYFIAGGAITSTTGPITATAGDIVATGGNIIAMTGDITAAFGDISAAVAVNGNSLHATTTASLGGQPNGVLVTDGAGVIAATQGAGGTVLTGQGAGVAPTFQNIVSTNAQIVVGYTAPNVTLTAAGSLPSAFNANVDHAIPVANILDIYGDTINTLTTGSGNQIVVTLQPNLAVTSVTTLAFVTAGGTITGNNIVSTHDVQASTGHFAVSLELASATNGVITTNGAGTMSASNGNPTGNNGQVLISGPVTPQWHTLTAGTGIAIDSTSVNNHITISAPGSAGSNVASFFARVPIDTGYITGDNSGNYAFLGATVPLSLAGADCFNTGGALYIGSGAGAPAYFAAPVAGTYLFIMNLFLYSAATTADLLFNTAVYNSTAPGTYYNRTQLVHFLTAGAYNICESQQTTQYIRLGVGDRVLFGVLYNSIVSPMPSIGVMGNGQSFISGFKVA